MPRIALVTCAALPDLDPDERLLEAALAAADVDVQSVVWNDPTVRWGAFDAAVIRSTWDYTEDVFAFREWASRAGEETNLFNAPDVIAWNTDKRYLLDLLKQGIPIVPTTFVAPEDRPNALVIDPAAHGEFVVKPAVSAGSKDTMRYFAATDLERASEHVERLLAEQRVVMIQPYLDSVDTIGETAMIFIGGAFSHAIRKGQMLYPGGVGDMVEGLYVREDISPITPTPDQLALAEHVLAAIPHAQEPPLYARVDVIADASGDPVLLELELTEPSLFFTHDSEASTRMAEAIVARAQERL